MEIFKNTVVDLGIIGQKTKHNVKFEIQDDRYVIKNAKGSCGCTNVKYTDKTISAIFTQGKVSLKGKLGQVTKNIVVTLAVDNVELKQKVFIKAQVKLNEKK